MKSFDNQLLYNLPTIVPDIEENCMGFQQCSCLKDIKERIKCENEGFATVFLAPIIAHITKELGDDYHSSIYPVVDPSLFPPKEHKKTDYFIFKIQNKCTRIIIELKVDVSNKINSGADFQKKMAQLMLEIYYAKEENHLINCGDRTILGILSDVNIFHCFIVDVSRQPFTFMVYVLINEPSNKLCNFIQYFITNY